MSQIIKPLFHYTYKNEAVILDSQYNYQGNMLAVCNSNGEIFFYIQDAEEQNREPSFSIDRKKINEKKNAPILKIAWSLPLFGLLASISISKQIDLHRISKSGVDSYLCKKSQYIPLCVSFCPIESEIILTVGFSDGSIIFYNQLFQVILQQQAHDQAINCLSWEHKILSYEKNKWIMNNFSHVKKFLASEELPLLISGSSDFHIKIWKFEKKKLIELCKVKAHLKAVRDVHWKPIYLVENDKMIITCSEDGYVKIWRIKHQNDKSIILECRCERNFLGPVYKANFNFMGNLVAISYCKEAQQKIQTTIMRQTNGYLVQEIKISN